MIDTAKLERTVGELLQLLANGDYAGFKRRDRAHRLSEQALAHAVTEYGRHLVRPAHSPMSIVDVVEVLGRTPPCWSVNVPLWTQEEGRSDLTLCLTLVDAEADYYGVEIDDLRVP